MKSNHPTLSLALAAVVFAHCGLSEEELTPKGYESPYSVFGSVERLDPALDDLLAPNAEMEALATGFDWSEGPVWDFQDEQLYFSDIPRNTVFGWSESEGLFTYLAPSGFTGESYDGREPGSNGLTFGPSGQLVLCQHGDRRVAQLNPKKWGYSTLADNYQGKRLNSPNDACYDSQGNLYFTDPPYGMGPSSERELDFHGVYRLSPEGAVTLLSTDLERPNGIALSPDEKTLYVANSHGPRPIIMAFPIGPDMSVGEGSVFFDSSRLREQGRRGGNDGLKTDVEGNVWATAPGGVIILNAQGKLLGSLLTGKFTANCAFGGQDGKTLYITADDVLCRIQTRVQGHFPFRK